VTGSTAGLDLSLTGTGICVTAEGVRTIARISTKPTDTLAGTHRRLLRIVADIEAYVPRGSLVCIEGPSMASKYGHPHDRSGLWWLVADMLYRHSCKVVAVPPTSRAKYATGKGNAGKDAVFAAAIRKHGMLAIDSNDVADAVILDDMANRLNGTPVDDPPATHLKAMEGIRS
jgi:Holliday junction resolvasome RuvABC endonuclease subunit